MPSALPTCYNISMESNPQSPGPPARLLVHICCGPCSIMPLKAVLDGKAEVWGFFHNPNIHPYAEFKKRLASVKTLARLMSIELICDDLYRPMGFIRGMKASVESTDPAGHPPEGERCVYCYSTRLEETARAALEHGFDGFTSSLLYSRYQDHERIRETGIALAEKYGIRFYYEDFRTRWQQGIDASKEMGLYRQKWCGCVYSRLERLAAKKRKQNKRLESRLESSS